MALLSVCPKTTSSQYILNHGLIILQFLSGNVIASSQAQTDLSRTLASSAAAVKSISHTERNMQSLFLASNALRERVEAVSMNESYDVP